MTMKGSSCPSNARLISNSDGLSSKPCRQHKTHPPFPLTSSSIPVTLSSIPATNSKRNDSNFPATQLSLSDQRIVANPFHADLKAFPAVEQSFLSPRGTVSLFFPARRRLKAFFPPFCRDARVCIAVSRAAPCQLSAEQRAEQWSGEPRPAAIVLARRFAFIRGRDAKKGSCRDASGTEKAQGERKEE